MVDTRQLGASGEDRAAVYLSHLGYEILDRNRRYSFGEIDILARDGKVIVLVEVKTGRTGQFGYAIERVGPKKQRKLRQLASRLEQDYQMATVRIDLVNVDGEEAVTHIKNALEYEMR